MHSRSGFAVLLVGMELYVCGGLDMTTSACEVWLRDKSEFIDSGHEWLTINSSGPRTGLTLHQFGKWLCAFGGRKFQGKGGATRQVTCFDTKSNTTVDLVNDCGTDLYRTNHASILYNGDTVILCGGQNYSYRACDVLKVKDQHKSCLGIKQILRWAPMHSSLLRWNGVILALGAVIDFNQKDLNSWRTHISRPFDGVFGILGKKPNSLRHSVSDVRLFNVLTVCEPPEQGTNYSSSSTTDLNFTAGTKEEAVVTDQSISVHGCPSRSFESLVPYQAALGCVGFICTLLFCALVYLVKKEKISITLIEDGATTGSDDIVQKCSSSTMSEYNMSSDNTLQNRESNHEVSSESIQKDGNSMTVHSHIFPRN